MEAVLPTMAEIPAGSFLRKGYTVRLSRFLLSATPITHGQYQATMGSNPAHFKGDDRPVEGVSWHDAVASCNDLSERAGLSPAYDDGEELVQGSDGFRLPTEAEWEYACRAGTDGDRYGPIDDIAWYRGNIPQDGPKPVACKKPNAWGLYDMLGNVFEWCHDWYGSYPTDAVTDPTGPGSGSSRVLRGGSWYNHLCIIRAAYRKDYPPTYRFSGVGFRVARSCPSDSSSTGPICPRCTGLPTLCIGSWTCPKCGYPGLRPVG